MILVTGGARSGKSTYAESLCKEAGGRVCYIATGKAIDDDMKDRIKKHREQRPSDWATIEMYKDFDGMADHADFLRCDTFLLDCVTIMVTNLMFDHDIDYDNCPAADIDAVEQEVFVEVDKLLEVMTAHSKQLILVTNEVGSGLVPSYRLGSIFRDIAGRVNQYLAKQADEVYCIISGLPLKLK